MSMEVHPFEWQSFGGAVLALAIVLERLVELIMVGVDAIALKMSDSYRVRKSHGTYTTIGVQSGPGYRGLRDHPLIVFGKMLGTLIVSALIGLLLVKTGPGSDYLTYTMHYSESQKVCLALLSAVIALAVHQPINVLFKLAKHLGARQSAYGYEDVETLPTGVERPTVRSVSGGGVEVTAE